jgi:hypothetical protein
MVNARAPSVVLNSQPALTTILRTVDWARLYSVVALDVMPLRRTLPPFFKLSSFIRSFVFATIIDSSLLLRLFLGIPRPEHKKALAARAKYLWLKCRRKATRR